MHHAIEINAVAAAGISRAEIETCLSVLARTSENLQRALDHVPKVALTKAAKPHAVRSRRASIAEE
jgi:hypothetical protein